MGSSRELDPFLKGKSGKEFDAYLKLDDGNIQFVFPKKGSGAKKKNDLEMVFQIWLYWYYYLKRCVISIEQENIFKWKHYQPDIILLTVRWYLRYNLSCRDLVEMIEERGLSLAHITIMR